MTILNFTYPNKIQKFKRNQDKEEYAIVLEKKAKLDKKKSKKVKERVSIKTLNLFEELIPDGIVD